MHRQALLVSSAYETWGHRDEATYNEFYAPRNPGTDGQGSYLGGTLRTTVNDLFRAMTLSRNPENVLQTITKGIFLKFWSM